MDKLERIATRSLEAFGDTVASLAWMAGVQFFHAGTEPLPDSLQSCSGELARTFTYAQGQALSDRLESSDAVLDFLSLLNFARVAKSEEEAANAWFAHRAELEQLIPIFRALGTPRQRLILATIRGRLVAYDPERAEAWKEFL